MGDKKRVFFFYGYAFEFPFLSGPDTERNEEGVGMDSSVQKQTLPCASATFRIASIAAYLISHVWAGFISRAWLRRAGKGFFAFTGVPYERLTLGCAVLLTEWLLLWWMHRNNVFLRI